MIPQADVFFYWGMPDSNAQMVEWIHRAVSRSRKPATVFLGFDWHYPMDRSNLVPQVLAYRSNYTSAHVHRLFFDEQGPQNEGFEASTDDPPKPTYVKPFAKRPGMWGVFHLVEVRVGKQLRARGTA